MVKDEIINALKKAVKELTGLEVEPKLDRPTDQNHGDYSTNIAMILFGNKELRIKNYGSPFELAEQIVSNLNSQFLIHNSSVARIEAVKPGFVNFWLSSDYLVSQLQEVLKGDEQVAPAPKQKIMVEYAHPNTHKEMHIGHMRTLITGESIARLLEFAGDKVFRANYQGDIGPHVARAIYGIKKIMAEKKLTLEEVEKWSSSEKAHFLGEGYVKGNQDYEDHKEEIDDINSKLYQMVSDQKQEIIDKDLLDIYKKTRKWSLDYYDDFYKRFYTKFDKLFFESKISKEAKEIVEQNVGKIFKRDQDAIIFPGENYGLHTRVFVTKAGYPTYEGKDMALGFRQYEVFPFDKNIHVVANEQASYFKVVFKALELLDAKKFKDKEYHLSMGMVQLTDRKMSSRTGEILTVDWLIDQVKEMVLKLISEGRINKEGEKDVLEDVVIGAIKYSVLKVGTGQDAQFDIKKSVSLDGNSGPYIQYSFARTQSVLAKFQNTNHPLRSEASKSQINSKFKISNIKLEPEELSLLRTINQFPEAVSEAGEKLAPNLLANYLFDLAQKFNLFYQKHKVIGSTNEEFRLALTAGVGKVLKNGLNLLGIESPERM